MKKRSVTILLFIIAIILSIFSLTMTEYVEISNAKGQTIEQNLEGEVRLEILPQENKVVSLNAENGER